MPKCELCGRWEDHLDTHHVFGGNKVFRKRSEQHGMLMKVCRPCHERIHHDPKLEQSLKGKEQAKFELHHTREEFMRLFRKSYL